MSENERYKTQAKRADLRRDGYSVKSEVGECKSWDGITIGLIDAIITIANVLNPRLQAEARKMKKLGEKDTDLEWLWFSQEVQDAMSDLLLNESVQQLLYPRDEKMMDIIYKSAETLKKAAEFPEKRDE